MPHEGEDHESLPHLARSSAGLQVIVCSLPRTGTSSIKLALERLGIRKVYHMTTFVENPEDYKYWAAVTKAKIGGKEAPRSVWDSLLGNYQAVVGAPACYFAVDLARIYPNAKIIILNRDSESWYNSFAQTVQRMIKRREELRTLERLIRPWVPQQGSAIIRLGNLLSRSGVGLGCYGKDECLKYYHDYYEYCRRNIPPQRYIECSVQDGWAPLCAHLGIPIPERKTTNGWVREPFPEVNDRETFAVWTTNLQRTLIAETIRNTAIQGGILLGLTLFLILARYFMGTM
ncbi:hypothetical protein F5Y17DRAFT_478619 [Xylariaceae sp. FL0594]|nr:hypothetical protein F5Y17DRAFT_478619 [Xylariaceae sp. FL0594]